LRKPAGYGAPWKRRRLLQSAGVVIAGWRSRFILPTLGVSAATSGATESSPALAPQPGDELVHAFGALQHQLISASALVGGVEPTLALPRDPATTVVRDASRLNQVVVLRLPVAELSTRTAAYAADGIIVYSAVCTHTGCTVEHWNSAGYRLVCACHGSEFQAADAARVIAGPAPRPLAMLPVKVEQDRLIVTGAFSRKVGVAQQP
jgi:rieske iron-sulfur protein